MNWYYAEAGNQVGPVTDEQLAELVRTRVITDDTLVWHEGMAAWTAYRSIKPASSTSETVVPGAPAQPAPAAAAVHFEYAGFWIRFVAEFLDIVILAVAIFVPAVILVIIIGVSKFGSSSGGGEPGIMAELVGMVVELAALVLQLAYGTFFVGKYGATPGKMICGLKVIRANGERISYGLAFGRYCAEILSGITCDIGYIMAAFDGQKRALHDHICGTRVVYK